MQSFGGSLWLPASKLQVWLWCRRGIDSCVNGFVCLLAVTFTCPLCGRVFKRKGWLTRHMAAHHGITSPPESSTVVPDSHSSSGNNPHPPPVNLVIAQKSSPKVKTEVNKGKIADHACK